MENILETIVLRFSNFEKINTIEEHKRIINETGKVYWGLWQKPYEKLISKEKTYKWTYSRDGEDIGEISFPRNIYLCNITARKVYLAECQGIKNVCQIDDTETIYIPKYYNNSSVEYYFLIKSIIECNYDAFHNENKSKLDFSSNDTILTEKDKHINVEYIKLSGNSILHISDLHFGENCNYKEGSHLQNPRDYAKLTSLLDKFNNLDDIGLIVASGDFANGKERKREDLYKKDFRAASDFLKELCKKLNLEPNKHLILVPGNHDKGFFEENFDPITGKMGNTYDQDYRNFQKELIGLDHFTYTKKYFLPNGNKLVFLCLDSSDLQSEQIREYGYVDKRQFELLGGEQNYDSSCIKIAVMHYPLVTPPTKFDISSYQDENGKYHAEALSVLENSFEIAKILTDNGFRYLFHGHQHYPYLGNYNVRNPSEQKEGNIVFLCAGSIGLNHTDTKCLYTDFLFNSFNLYTFHEKKICVKVYSFIPTLNPTIVDECYLDLII